MINLSDIIKKENIITVSGSEILSSTLAKLSTSHDAAFVFGDRGEFTGVINPYYCLIRSSYPGNAKVAHCLYHPPRLYIDYDLSRVASLFIESKIHYLPVFNRGEEFLGIISARRLLIHLRKLPIFEKKIGEAFDSKRKPLVVISEEDKVSKAINLFKSTKYSKLIVINRDLKLRGILSYYDLISFMTSSRDRTGRREKFGNKSHLSTQPIKNFIKTYVLTLKKENSLREIFNLIVDKKIGSVIIVDEERHPIGIFTTRDLLRFFIDQERGDLFKKVSSGIGKFLSKKKI